MNRKVTLTALTIIGLGVFFVLTQLNTDNSETFSKKKRTKKTLEEKQQNIIDRYLHDFNMQKNPFTNTIPRQEKESEFEFAMIEKQNGLNSRITSNTYTSRGPSNLGGRTRAVVVDISDATGNTMIAGGVSSGVFKTTDGGTTWTKVSSNSEIHNVTSIVQDPRPGNQNIWYYGTGEWRGNSARLGNASFYGQGVWKSTDSGNTWQQIPETAAGSFTVFDNFLDFVIDLDVHPITGELFIASAGKVYYLTSRGLEVAREISNDNTGWTDIEITSTGTVYIGIDGDDGTNGGVWTSPNGSGGWTRIAQNGDPTDFSAGDRITLAVAPSNENIVYALIDNGQSNNSSNRVSEADLWQYNATTLTWTDYSSKMPDEPGDDSDGNDPFSHQGSYDLVVSVKPSDENFVIIGGTNIYKINDITSDAMFSRIGGYRGPGTYALYNEGGVSHHPDIHAFAWDLNDDSIMYSGTDGGVHKTNNVNSNFVQWVNLNNNYLTYQYYHVNMLNQVGSDYIIGGAQDNGTTIGGLDANQGDNSSMSSIVGGDGAAVALAGEDRSDLVYRYCTTQRGPLYRLPSTGGFSRIDPTGANSKFVTYFYMDPDNTSTLYYASNSTIYRTNDAVNVTSADWDNLGVMPFGAPISVYSATRGAYDPASSYLLVGAETGSLFRLNDPHNVTDLSTIQNITPSDVVVGLGSGDGQYVSGIAIHPTNPDIVIVVYSTYGDTIKNIFVTSDATAATPTWTEVERNLAPFSIRAAAIAEVNGETQYYVGTARGLYKTLDPTTTDWSIEGSNTLGLAVISGLVYRPSDNRLLVGTHGNGMFDTTVNSTLSLTDNSNDVRIAMYPNPTQFDLTFASNEFGLEDTTQYTIYDVRGTTIANGTLSNRKIDVSTLSRGMYVVNLQNGTKTVSRKFVKN